MADGSGGVVDDLKRALSPVIARVTETVLPADRVGRMRAARDWRRWVDSLTPELLEDLTAAPTEVKQGLFKAQVTRVEIETHSRCNRICSFCPNVIFDRRRDRTVTDAEMLDRVFDELGAIGYARQICVARYSEPLANMTRLLETIASARRRVPRAELAITTNTDYMRAGTLDRLREAGLNRVYMSIYLRKRETWSRELAWEYSRRLADKLGVRISGSEEGPAFVRCDYAYRGMTVLSYCRNFAIAADDRGATLEQFMTEERIGPCRAPFDTFVVDYTGAVMPCCNLRSDNPAHVPMIVGDLAVPGASIFDIYAGRLAGWRRSMVSFGRKDSPCTTCRHGDVPAAIAATIESHLDRHMKRIGLADGGPADPARSRDGSGRQ